MGIVAGGLVILALALSVPPLTDAQQHQLATAEDNSSRLDEGALYPLLENALLWQSGDEAGAMIPDYGAIRQSPAEYRGKLFLIEGKLVRRELVDGLARSGEWDGRLEQWVIQWGRSFDDVAVVYVVTPPASVSPGQQVRLAARFYKLWQTGDEQGKSFAFVTFVGHDARRIAGSWTDGSSTQLAMTLLVVLLMVGAYLLLRRRVSLATGRSDFPRPRHDHEGQIAQEHDVLPNDPTEALAELRRRHEQDQTSSQE